MGMHVIITGNPVDGFSIIGPFATVEEAVQWAESVDLESHWWAAPLEAQVDYED